ncbi:MAG: YihY/virulence factor BrkB family protein [Vicinamibacterales bacterium]
MTAGRHGMALLRETLDLWLSNNAFQHAGALAFYTLFSLAAVEGAVQRSRVEQAGLWPTILGVSAVIFGSTTVFAQMQSSLNQVWGVAARPSRSGLVVFATTRLASLGLVLIIGFLLLVSFLVTMLIATLVQFAGSWIPVQPFAVTALDVLASLLVSTLLFAMIFKVLPDVRLHWHDMWRGAFVTATLFVGGQSLISLYLTRAAPASTYGAAGALVVVLMWVYYSSLIVFMGAAMTRAMVRLRGDRLVPKSTAVRVTLSVQEE